VIEGAATIDDLVTAFSEHSMGFKAVRQSQTTFVIEDGLYASGKGKLRTGVISVTFDTFGDEYVLRMSVDGKVLDDGEGIPIDDTSRKLLDNEELTIYYMSLFEKRKPSIIIDALVGDAPKVNYTLPDAKFLPSRIFDLKNAGLRGCC